MSGPMFILLLFLTILYRSRAYEPGDPFFPWMGLIRVHIEPNQQGVAGLILIQKKIALANSLDIGSVESDIIKFYSRAMFFDSTHKPVYFKIQKFILNKEYEVRTMNTLAIVYLEGPEAKSFQWKPINWPERISVYHEVYQIGFEDKEKVLEQAIHKLTQVSTVECEQFYQEENLDFETIWPSYYSCFKESGSTRQCVYDAGMALVTNYTGIWVLLGIGVLGPGCRLPARFIDFPPYMDWVRDTITPARRAGRNRFSGLPGHRRADGTPTLINDTDRFVFAQLANNKIVMKPSSSIDSSTPEQLGQGCGQLSVLLYKEYGKFDTPEMLATAVMSVSLFDTAYMKTICVEVNVHCKKRSKTELWTTIGFNTYKVNEFQKKSNINYLDSKPTTVPPDKRVWFLVDSYDYVEFNITHLYFKFTFEDVAKVELLVYGPKDKYVYVRWTTTTTRTTEIVGPQMPVTQWTRYTHATEPNPK